MSASVHFRRARNGHDQLGAPVHLHVAHQCTPQSPTQRFHAMIYDLIAIDLLFHGSCAIAVAVEGTDPLLAFTSPSATNEVSFLHWDFSSFPASQIDSDHSFPQGLGRLHTTSLWLTEAKPRSWLCVLAYALLTNTLNFFIFQTGRVSEKTRRYRRIHAQKINSSFWKRAYASDGVCGVGTGQNQRRLLQSFGVDLRREMKYACLLLHRLPYGARTSRRPQPLGTKRVWSAHFTHHFESLIPKYLHDYYISLFSLREFPLFPHQSLVFLTFATRIVRLHCYIWWALKGGIALTITDFHRKRCRLKWWNWLRASNAIKRVGEIF